MKNREQRKKKEYEGARKKRPTEEEQLIYREIDGEPEKKKAGLPWVSLAQWGSFCVGAVAPATTVLVAQHSQVHSAPLWIPRRQQDRITYIDTF